MDKILETKDKSGRNIYITSERWRHILKHPEMSDKIEEIKETLLSPTKITIAYYDPNVRFYFRYYKERKEYLFISVKYLNGKGYIITSFYTDKIK